MASTLHQQQMASSSCQRRALCDQSAPCTAGPGMAGAPRAHLASFPPTGPPATGAGRAACQVTCLGYGFELLKWVDVDHLL